ncbi:MAG: YeeE/YedE family protein [Bradyrhizobiaceae bacterium]|nr:YeeE/YedE family protein [Bradyrhizobiaceae bacterium]
MTNFTPISAAIGGALIGLSATLLMLLTGRIAGISGIVGNGLSLALSDKAWRIAFVTGLLIVPVFASWVGYPMPSPQMPASWVVIIAAGFLVGLGSRLGGGCTSGHGICGLARLSARSFMATALFMFSAIVVVALTHHVFAG